MKKTLCLIFAVLLVFRVSPANASGAQNALLDSNGYAKVIEIIDGDSIRVSFLSTGETALVRFIGVNAEGYDGAIPYLNNTILGKTVALYFDNAVPKSSGRWNNMYLYIENSLINRELIYLGYAKADGGHGEAALYEFFSAGEESAKDGGVGIWKPAEDLFAPFGRFVRGETNINTASRAMLRELLNAALYGDKWAEGRWVESDDNNNDGYWSPGYWDIGEDGETPEGSERLIDEIIYYRARNPFNTVSELKFAKGITKEIFGKLREKVTVVTNLAAASAKELCTLGDITPRQVNRILKDREAGKLSSVDDFMDSVYFSSYSYNQIKPFVSVSNITEIDVRIPPETVNLNDATVSELMRIGLRQADAEKIVSWRKTGFTYKSIGEAGGMLGLNQETLNAFEDNFTLSDFTVFYFEGININTAAESQLKDCGMDSRQISAVLSRQRRMLNFYDIPVVIPAEDFDKKISLYTNINAASRAELESVFTNSGAVLINDLISYRNDQPFGSLDEVREFFASRGEARAFTNASEFIVLR